MLSTKVSVVASPVWALMTLLRLSLDAVAAGGVVMRSQAGFCYCVVEKGAAGR